MPSDLASNVTFLDRLFLTYRPIALILFDSFIAYEFICLVPVGLPCFAPTKVSLLPAPTLQTTCGTWPVLDNE